MGGTVFNTLKGAVAALLALLCAWPLITLSLSDHFVAKAVRDGARDDNAVQRALYWDPSNPLAHRRLAERMLAKGDADSAARHLREAIRGNPADGMALAQLAGIEAQADNFGVSDALAETANRLSPVSPSVQRQLGYYWLGRQKPEQGLSHLARALYGDRREYHDEIFSLLLRVAEDPDARGLLAPYVSEPPSWWDDFFRHLAQEAQDLETVRSVYAARRASSNFPTSAAEDRRFTDRLARDGQVAEAYLAWVNALPPEALAQLGYLYNGGFERPPANHGFDWVARPPRNHGIEIGTARTPGMGGQAALKLSFRGDRQRFSHLHQRLFLAPGSYRVRGRVRPERLEARRGLQWRVVCTTGSTGWLAESELFSGDGEWREFSFDLVVPPTCAGQILRLVSAGSREVDHEVSGVIWFDDLVIEGRS